MRVVLVFLTGFMGTGKTAVARRLAAILGWPWVDTDQEIEKVTGLAIEDIFRKHGEIRFRSEETLALKRIVRDWAGQPGIVSTGGGMVLKAENVELMRAHGVIIGLTATPEVIFQRVKMRQLRKRPLLRTKGDVRARIEELLSQREPVYRSVAEVIIDTSSKEPEQIARELVEWIKGRMAGEKSGKS